MVDGEKCWVVSGYLVRDKRLKLSGFLCPGHVSAIIGARAYEFIPQRHRIACCVAGFEPLDVLEGVLLLLKQIVKGKPRVDNQYARVVKSSGNKKALKVIKEVFKVADVSWRGLGVIPKSGLKLRKEYSQFDAEKQFSIKRSTLDPSTWFDCAHHKSLRAGARRSTKLTRPKSHIQCCQNGAQGH